MKFHKIITAVVGISSLVAGLLLIDARPTQAMGECFDRAVLRNEVIITEVRNSEDLSFGPGTQARIQEIRESEDGRYLLITACLISSTKLVAQLESGRDLYKLEFPAQPINDSSPPPTVYLSDPGFGLYKAG